MASAGCDKGGTAASNPDTEVHTYTVLGQIEELPAADKPRSEFIVHHEAIPLFVGPGTQMGMESMSMPFPVGKDVKLDGLAVGDKIALTFSVVYDTAKKRPKSYAATDVKRMPADTKLDFGPK